MFFFRASAILSPLTIQIARAADENREMADEQEAQAGQWSQALDTLKKAVLLFLVANTAVSLMGKKDDSPAAQTTATNDLVKQMKPTPANSTFLQLIKPVDQWTLVDVLDDDEGAVVSRKKVKTAQQQAYENSLLPPMHYYPLWREKEYPIDLQFYVNDQLDITTGDDPLFELFNVTINSKNDLTEHFVLHVPDSVKIDNGTLYLHALISRPGFPDVAHKIMPLSTYMPKKKGTKLHKLIGDDTTVDDEHGLEQQDDQPPLIVPYWHPNVTVSIVKTPGSVDTKAFPPAILDVFSLDPLDRRDNATGQVVQYFPIVYQNKFWQLKNHMTEINATSSSLELNLHVDFAAFWKIQALLMFDDGIKQQQNNPMSMMDGSEVESFKRIILDTNPYLLAITIAVSILHSLLEFMAFKSDISHWRNKKNNVGVSVRSIVANVVQQIITLLYLLDSSEGTSFMILASQGTGIVVEAWKITTIVHVEIQWDGVIPNVTITDKHKLSETEEKTKEYDSIAFKYLYWVALPLLICYAIYSVMYKEHKSWYSFVVTTLVGFVYTYGFLTLVPSVYINYRLKSVAHVPQKAMAYKVVNTFIDDLFAFVVKMPWLHRLATLRDDVIFFIYLYQTWIYRVDYRRVNEFGQGGDGGDDETTVEKEVVVVDEEDGTKVVTKESKKNK